MKQIIIAVSLLGLFAAIVLPGCAPFKRWAYNGFSERDEWQKPRQVIESLHLQLGQRVMDLGAGGGYFSFLLAKAVGEQGMVYAVDSDASMVAYITNQVEQRGITNLKAILVASDNPKIEEKLDLILVVNTYHHLPSRISYFKRLALKLKPHGRIAIIEYKGEKGLAKFSGHATPSHVILSEMQDAGYHLSARHEFLARQSFQIFSVIP